MSQNLISLSEACERYEKTDDGFYSSAFLFKKKNGKHPDWYVQNIDGDVQIDVYEYERYAILERKAWLLATNDIYYLLTYDYGMTDWAIAKWMSRHSKKFTDLASWSSFISASLFSLPRDSVLQKRLSMTVDFVVSGTYLLSILMREERNNEKHILPIRD